jgi:hypothetical protein
MVTGVGGRSILTQPGRVKRVSGLLLAAAGLVVLAFAGFNLARDASLWVLGRRIEARVIGTWIEHGADDRRGMPVYHWYVRYQFTTPTGRMVTGSSRMAAQEWTALGLRNPVELAVQGQGPTSQAGGATLEEGPSVDVVYFPAYPDHNRLDQSRFVPVLACAYVPLIVLGWGGLAAGRRLLQTR